MLAVQPMINSTNVKGYKVWCNNIMSSLTLMINERFLLSSFKVNFFFKRKYFDTFTYLVISIFKAMWIGVNHLSSPVSSIVL